LTGIYYFQEGLTSGIERLAWTINEQFNKEPEESIDRQEKPAHTSINGKEKLARIDVLCFWELDPMPSMLAGRQQG
jgi:hypothetical protein